MVLPSTGTLSLSQIYAEFNSGTVSYSMSWYYADNPGGLWTPGIPSTGSSISFSQFRGKFRGGSVTFTTPGTSIWNVPANITSLSIVCIGGGGGGGTGDVTSDGTSAGSSYNTPLYSGGGGGGLAYRNNISLTTDFTATVVVGAAGTNSTTIGTAGTSGISSYVTIQGITTRGYGGAGGSTYYCKFDPNLTYFGGGGAGGVYAGTGGGNGGKGGDAYFFTSFTYSYGGATRWWGTPGRGGGGGAGGYNATGGASGIPDVNYVNTGTSTTATGTSGGTGLNGGGGGSGGTAQAVAINTSTHTIAYWGSYSYRGGGGAGIYGDNGVDGAGGTGGSATYNGSTGSAVTNGAAGNGSGIYGGGGIGSDPPAQGAVRIVWPGTTRAFPSTLVSTQ